MSYNFPSFLVTVFILVMLFFVKDIRKILMTEHGYENTKFSIKKTGKPWQQE